MIQMHLAKRVARNDDWGMAIALPVSSSLLSSRIDATVEALLAGLELRHAETEKHARRVAGLATLLTLAVDSDLAAEPGVREGYLLHDIGKLGVPDAILLKPGPLHELEWRIVERHPCLGAELTRRLGLPERTREVVGGHHERWDGRGYPAGLAGEEIPLPARIFAVIDTFDAMTHDRPYRAASAPDVAFREVERCNGTQFDPRVVEAFLGLAASGSLPGDADAEGETELQRVLEGSLRQTLRRHAPGRSS